MLSESTVHYVPWKKGETTQVFGIMTVAHDFPESKKRVLNVRDKEGKTI